MAKKIGPIIKKIPKLPNVKKHVIKLSEKTIEKTQKANVFFSEVADFYLFLSHTTKEAFSRNFEFKEFLRQCFQIGNKTLPLISITSCGLLLSNISFSVLIMFMIYPDVKSNR